MQPVEETGLVMKGRGRNLICLCSSPFLPDIHWMLPMDLWNESDAPTFCSFFFFLCTTCSSNRPVADAIGFPFFPSLSCPCIITLILICCHPSLLPPSVRNLSPFQTPPTPRYPVSAFTPLYLFCYSLCSHLYQPHRNYLPQPDLKSRSRNRKPDLAKHSVDSSDQLDYICKPFDYPIRLSSLPPSFNFTRWETRLFSLSLPSFSIYKYSPLLC